jgi:hypothetical protein
MAAEAWTGATMARVECISRTVLRNRNGHIFRDIIKSQATYLTGLDTIITECLDQLPTDKIS